MLSLQMPLLIVVMLIAAIYSFGNRSARNKKKCVILITIILALFSGLRSWWMGDLIKYYTQYRNCNGVEWWNFVTADPYNAGMRWFFRIAGALWISYDNCILIISVFSAVTLGILVYRYSSSPYWSYMMFIAMGFYLFTYTGLKQTVAMGFLMLAAMAMYEQKFWKYLLFVVLGGWFHFPAFIFLAAYPFCRQKLNGRYFAVLLGVVVVLLMFRTQIVNFITSVYYDDKEAYTETSEVGGRFVMMLLIMILAIVLRPLHSWDKVYLQTFNLMVFAAALQTMSVFDNVFTRLADYYYQFVVLFVPMLMQSGYSQAKELPEHRQELRYWASSTYVLLGLGITLFGLWYYNNYINSAWATLNDFVFRWEIDPYSLYGQ